MAASVERTSPFPNAMRVSFFLSFFSLYPCPPFLRKIRIPVVSSESTGWERKVDQWDRIRSSRWRSFSGGGDWLEKKGRKRLFHGLTSVPCHPTSGMIGSRRCLLGCCIFFFLFLSLPPPFWSSYAFLRHCLCATRRELAERERLRFYIGFCF